MKDVEVVEVEGRRALAEFLELPYRLYAGDPYWVPPLRLAQKQLLDTRKHPFWAHAELQCFLARAGGRTVGRVAAVLDRSHVRHHGEEAGFFGFLEVVNSQDVAAALLDAARRWLATRGALVVRGPMNPSTNYECGMLVQGFDSSPCVMMTYNLPYYPTLVEGAGFRKAMDLHAYWLDVDDLRSEKIDRVAGGSVRSEGIVIRPIRMDRFEAEVENVWRVYNSAWSANWGFTPMTREEFLAMAAEMKPILRPELVLLGEAGGRTVGFALALPDINLALKGAGGRLFPLGLLKLLYHRRRIRVARVIALGVIEEYRTAGVAAGLYAALIRAGLAHGIHAVEISWVLENNVLMNRSAEMMGGKRYKTYRIYEWRGDTCATP